MPFIDAAEAAIARANLSHDEEGSSAAGKALPLIGALRSFADGMQRQTVKQALHLQE